MGAAPSASSATALSAGLLGFGVMLLLQPRPGEADGEWVAGHSFFVVQSSGLCWHVHHWIPCVGLAAFLLWTLYCSGGRASPAVSAALGLLLGVAASDAVYPDLSLSRHCVVSRRSGHIT